MSFTHVILSNCGCSLVGSICNRQNEKLAVYGTTANARALMLQVWHGFALCTFKRACKRNVEILGHACILNRT